MLALGSVIRAQLILQVLRVIQQLALVYFLVRVWGGAYFSDWVVLSSAASFFSLADFGIQTALGNACVGFSRRCDHHKLSQLVQQALAFYIIFVPITLVLCIAFASACDLGVLIKTSTLSETSRA